MSRSVSGELPLPAEEILQQLEEAAEKHNVNFTGDTRYGEFSAKGFAGNYLVEDGRYYTLTITKKPRIVPWKLVEKQLHRLAYGDK